MTQIDVKIGDATSAANAFWTLSKLSGSTRVPFDQDDLSSRLSRVTGRGRNLAVALRAYVEAHGFDTLHNAVSAGRNHRVPEITSSTQGLDAEAAAKIGLINFEELDRASIIFASSGFY